MASQKRFSAQLYDRPLGGVMAGPAITGAGGMVLVTANGTAAKATLYDRNGAAIANPVPLVRGSFEFWTLASVASVDLYLMAPDGQFVTLSGVVGDSLADIPVDRSNPHQCMIVPLLGSDYTDATEVDTGIDVPAQADISPFAGIQILVAQAKTIDIGLLSSESGGDADGFFNDISLTTTAKILPAKSASTATRGALLGAGTLDYGHATDSVTSKSLSVTGGTGWTTGACRLYLPYLNLKVAQPTL